VPSSRSGIGSASWIVRPGSEPGPRATRKTSPVSGAASSGVPAVTVPTLELTGHARAAALSAGQARLSWDRSGPRIGGSVTVADDWPACSAPWVMIVVTGGLAWRAVKPRAPTAPAMCGSNASAPQSVGVNSLVRDLVAPPP
jgi:hypothetical protein